MDSLNIFPIPYIPDKPASQGESAPAAANTPAPRVPVPKPPETDAKKAVRSTDFITQVQASKDRKKLEELEALKDSISEMIVHDLKDPLTVIQGNLQYLLEELQETGGVVSPKMEQSIRTCLNNCKRQMNLITDLWDVSQFDPNRMKLNKTKTHFPKLVDDCLAALSPEIQKQGIAVRKIYHQGIPLVNLDETVIKRVLMNLLSNGLKFTKPPEGKIVISVNWTGTHWLECIIEDNGMVIPREHLSKVFDKFFKGDYLGRFRKGQGMGLAFCRLAVEAHGGDIWAERSLPKGNRFVLLLPGL